MMDSSVPKVRALCLPATARRGERTVMWCGHCEETHHHGASGGLRTAHCAGRDSPYCATGYDLDVQGVATDAREILPKAIYAGRRRFRTAIERAAPTIRAAFLRSVFGTDRARARFEKRIGRARLTVLGQSWLFDPDGFVDDEALVRRAPWADRVIQGTGSISLLAMLYGVPRGFIAVRLLQAISGERFDAQAWSEIAAAVDAWAVRRDGERGGHL